MTASTQHTESAERIARPLIQLAKINGISTSYIDQLGTYVEIRDEVLVSVLAALGVDASTEQAITDSYAEARLRCPKSPRSRCFRSRTPQAVPAWRQQPSVRLPSSNRSSLIFLSSHNLCSLNTASIKRSLKLCIRSHHRFTDNCCPSLEPPGVHQ